MNIDLIVCNACAKRRRPASRRLRAIDELTGVQYDIDVCPEHDRMLHKKFLGTPLANGARVPKRAGNATGSAKPPGAREGLAHEPALTKAKGKAKANGHGGARAGSGRKKRIVEPVVAVCANGAKRLKASGYCPKKRIGRPPKPAAERVSAEKLKRRRIRRTLGDPAIHVSRDGSRWRLAGPPFTCGTCDAEFAFFRALSRHARQQKHTMPGEPVGA